MLLPQFVKTAVRSYPCPKCKQIVRPDENVATEVGVKKRPEMAEPSITITIECPRCGTASGVGLGVTIPWTDLLDWLMDMAHAHHHAEAPNGLVSANDIPKDERLWFRLDERLFLFRLLGGYRRGSQTYLLCRRIPLQPAGWDGRVFDAVLRLKRDQKAEMVGEDDPLYMPLGQWHQFLGFPAGFEFQMAGGAWRKLSSSALREVTQKGTYAGASR